MKKMLIAAFTALLAVPAFAATPQDAASETCTPDDANRLAAQVAERVNDILKNDPDRAAAINEELGNMRLQRTGENLEHECDAYRTRLQEIEEARKRAGLPHEDDLNTPTPSAAPSASSERR